MSIIVLAQKEIIVDKSYMSKLHFRYYTCYLAHMLIFLAIFAYSALVFLKPRPEINATPLSRKQISFLITKSTPPNV